MKVLYLGPPSRISEWLEEIGNDVVKTDRRLGAVFAFSVKPDMVVSFNYRHIITADVLPMIEGKAFNIHTSYLPCNRGAHPNFWSWLEHSKKGVSIHRIDAGIDTGAIVAREEVVFENPEGENLESTYRQLEVAAERLFREFLSKDPLENLPLEIWRDPKLDSYHNSYDIEPYRKRCLLIGWETSVCRVSSYLDGLWRGGHIVGEVDDDA